MLTFVYLTILVTIFVLIGGYLLRYVVLMGGQMLHQHLFYQPLSLL